MAYIQYSRFGNDKASNYPVKAFTEVWYRHDAPVTDWPAQPGGPLYPNEAYAEDDLAEHRWTVEEVDVAVTLTLRVDGGDRDVTRSTGRLYCPHKPDIRAVDVVFVGVLQNGRWALQVTLYSKWDPDPTKRKACFSKGLLLS